MAEPNALCEPIATTSLYEEEGSDRSTALTLEEAAAEYVQLRPPTAAETSAYRETAPFLVVQLRKRRGKVEVLLDGHLSKGVEETRGDETVLVHNLYWHNGVHEDADTRTRVLSPVVVACAAEDGQRSIRDVKVRVWQSFLGLEASTSWQLLSETNLSPHRVSDARCRAVAVPYPVPYHPQPRVSIYINIARRQKLEKQRFDKLKAIFAEIAGQQLGRAFVEDAPMETIAVEAGAAMVLMAFLSHYLDAYLSPGATSAFLGAVRGYGAIALANNTVIGANNAVLSNIDPFLTDQLALEARDATVAQYTAIGKFITSIAANYFGDSVDSNPKVVRFTLKEFARTLEVIAAALSGPGPTGTSAQAVVQHYTKQAFGRNEWMLWDWMAYGETSKDATSRTKGDNFQSGELLMGHSLGTRLHVTIDVQDEFECMAGTSRHELQCKRDDAFYLSNAAAGTLDDLKRVTKAVEQLRTTLGPVDGSTSGALNAALQSIAVRPFNALRNYFQGIRDKESLRGHFSKKNWYNALLKATGTTNKDLDAPDELDLRNATMALRQFEECFLEEAGNGMRLRRRIETAILSKGQPLSNDTRVCTRRLPQRVGRTNFTYLFRAGQKLSTEFVEVVSLSTVVREFSEYDDAGQSLQAAMTSGAAYLRRFAPQWETRAATRVALDCVCRDGPDFAKATEPAGAPLCSTLAIATPVDIHFAGAVSRLMEKSLRRIRFVVKRAQQRCDPSVLEALGLKHTNEDLLACQVFGDLWADELVALHKSNNARRPQMQMLEQASRRAAARLRALGTLLLELFAVLPQVESDANNEYEIAPEVSDVAFRATLAGRDAALLVGKLLFARDDFEVRSVMTPIVRRSAAAAVRAAAAFERSVPIRLPHEPLASLFGARSEGVAAFERARQIMDDDVAARRAIVAAYASSRLISNEQHDEALALVRSDPYTPWRNPPRQSVDEVLAAMRYRMASLRMDHDPLEVAESLSALNIDDHTDELAVAKGTGYEFYVPFGFGDARPAPALPPCPAPMFGSVPVMGVHLRDAFESIARALKATNAPAFVPERELRVLLAPVLRCMPPLGEADQETNSVHPNVVQVLPMTTDGHIEARFSASRSRSGGLRASGNGDLNERSRDLADAHRCNRDSLEMAHEVASLAWNAERVVQCVVAALASAKGMNSMETIGIELELPSHENYRESWYIKQPREGVDAALRDLKKCTQDLKKAEMRKASATMEREDLAAKLRSVEAAHDAAVDPGPAGLLQDVKDEPEWQRIASKLADARRVAEAYDATYARYEIRQRNAQARLAAARVDFDRANESTKRSLRLLLGSVGVGMAMLSALVSSANIRVELRLVSATPVGITADKPNDASLRFARSAAVRLSEACLLISQTW
jgi:hypothetical protein